MSTKTQSLYDEREQLHGRGTQAQYDDIQARIKESSLADFENWVSAWANKISNAERVGNTKGIYDGVNALAKKNERPSPNLTTDQGDDDSCPWSYVNSDEYTHQ